MYKATKENYKNLVMCDKGKTNAGEGGIMRPPRVAGTNEYFK